MSIKVLSERNIAVLSLTTFLTRSGMAMFMVIWQPFILSLGASMAIVGLLGSILTLIGSITSPLWGIFSDTLGRKKFVSFVNVLRAASLIPCILAYELNLWPILVAYSIIAGLSSSIRRFNPATAAIIAESVPVDARGKAYSLLMFIGRLTSIVFSTIGGLIAYKLGYLPIFLFWFAAELSSAVIFLIYGEETLERESRARRQDYKMLLKVERNLIGVYISFTVDAIAWGTGGAIFYGMLKKTYDFNTYQLGLLSTTMQISWALSQIPLGILSDKIGRKPLLILSEGMGIIALLGWLNVNTFECFLFFQIFVGLMAASWAPISMAIIADLIPEKMRGSTIGKIQFIRGVISFPAPIIGGILYDYYGFNAPIEVNLALALLAVSLIYLLVKEPERIHSKAGDLTN